MSKWALSEPKRKVVVALLHFTSWVNGLGGEGWYLPELDPRNYTKDDWITGKAMENEIRLDDYLGVKNEKP